MSRTILLVEDSADDVFFMKRAFKIAGVNCPLHVAQDGQQALDYLGGKGAFADRQAFPLPSLVLLDLRLPLVPGFDVLKWMRGQDALSCIPVAVLTSSKEESDMQRAYSLGANSFLVKSAKSDDLLGLVKTLSEYWLKYNAVPFDCPAVSF